MYCLISFLHSLCYLTVPASIPGMDMYKQAFAYSVNSIIIMNVLCTCTKVQVPDVPMRFLHSISRLSVSLLIRAVTVTESERILTVLAASG